MKLPLRLVTLVGFCGVLGWGSAAFSQKPSLPDDAGFLEPVTVKTDLYPLDADAGQIVKEKFVLVHVDIGQGDKNLDLAKKYKIPLDKGVPAVAILKGDGALVYGSGDGEFES